MKTHEILVNSSQMAGCRLKCLEAYKKHQGPGHMPKSIKLEFPELRHQ